MPLGLVIPGPFSSALPSRLGRTAVYGPVCRLVGQGPVDDRWPVPMSFGLSRLDLEHYAAADRRAGAGGDAAVSRSTVEIACRVSDHTCRGICPVRPPLKLCNTVSTPVVSNLNTTPWPDTPPMTVVPKRLPTKSRTRPAWGYLPSVPPVKLCSTVSVPVVSSLNTTPAPDAPPTLVVP